MWKMLLGVFLGFIVFTSSTLGCRYKGNVYQDGDTILLDDPCLACECKQSSLVCNTRTCPQLPEKLQEGCVTTHEENQCCPQVQCDRRVNVARKVDLSLETTGCLINGSKYSEGFSLPGSNLCEYCYCINGQQRCTKPHCTIPADNCVPNYTENACCPTNYDCDVFNHTTGCSESGVNYLEGAMMPSNKSCQQCYCFETEKKCTPIRCTIQHLDGCYPIYAPNQCCPTTYNCTTENEADERIDNDIYETTTDLTTVTTDPTHFDTSTGEPIWTTNTIEFTSEQTTTEEASTRIEPYALNLTKIVLSDNKTNLLERAQPLDDLISSNGTADDDYDTYDYSDLKLPPSLPNLVIIPFVAADAVTKDKKKDETRRYDVNDPLYINSNYFSPPTETEGGFVPKDKPVVEVPVYDTLYVDPKETSTELQNLQDILNITPQSITTSTAKTDDCSSDGVIYNHNDVISEISCVLCKCIHGEITCQDIICNCQEKKECCTQLECKENQTVTTTVTSESLIAAVSPVTIADTIDLTPDPFRDVLHTEPAPDLHSLMNDLPPHWASTTTLRPNTTTPSTNSTRKPVSVTSKHAVVDYYPGGHQVTTLRRTTTETTTPSATSTEENSFIEEFLKGFFNSQKEVKVSPTETPPLSTTTIATVEVREENGNVTSFSFDTMFNMLFNAETTTVKTKRRNSTRYTRKPILKKTKRPPTTLEIKSTTPKPQTETQFVTEKETGFPKINILEQEKPRKPIKNSVDLGVVLKLAGCNIYGRMYRVGKIIAELSGPCLECMCTDTGVQCSQLVC